uniref:Uncharacterized protein n=1 Tax=Anguilla anguilla TaxID=7936 RepID=A0A0E9RPG5_ANGAN
MSNIRPRKTAGVRAKISRRAAVSTYVWRSHSSA